MKEFAIYTLARVGMFVASFVVIWAIFWAFGSSSILIPVVLAAVASGVASYFLLSGPRERFATRVDARAHAMADRFEQARAKEDQD